MISEPGYKEKMKQLMSEPQGRNAYRYARKLIKRNKKVQVRKSKSRVRPAVEVLFGLSSSEAPEEEPYCIEPESPLF